MSRCVLVFVIGAGVGVSFLLAGLLLLGPEEAGRKIISPSPSGISVGDVKTGAEASANDEKGRKAHSLGASAPKIMADPGGQTVVNVSHSSPSKDAAMTEIFSAMVTYSDEGVVRLTGYLNSPDGDIKRAAVEALKQIRTPSSTKALRDAAAKAETKEDRKVFSEAADFLELPPFDPKRRKESKVEVRVVD